MKRLGIMCLMVNRLLYQKINKSILFRVLTRLFSPELRIFSTTCLYYFSLFVSINNRTLLLFTAAYCVALYIQLKNLKLVLFLAFIVTLPFAKGKGFQIFLLDKHDVLTHSLFDLVYYFPLYLSDFILSLFLYSCIRDRKEPIQLSTPLKLIIFVFTLFVLFISIQTFNSPFPTVILFSLIQLIKLLAVFLLPYFLQTSIKKIHTILPSILAASLLFQSSWAVLQVFFSGPLGKDIEVYLPGTESGIYASEQGSLLRVSGTFYEPSILGTFLLMQMIFLGYHILNRTFSKTSTYLYTGILCFSTIALLFTGSRIIYFLFLGWSGALLYVFRDTWKKRIVFSKKQVSIALIIFFLIGGRYIFTRFTQFGEAFAKYGSATYRFQLAQAATTLGLTYWQGVGINLSQYFFATDVTNQQYIFDPAYPHNIFFQLLAETGIIGVSLFVTLLYLIYRAHLVKERLKLNGFTYAFSVFLTCAQFYPIFLNHPEILSYLFVFAGLSLYEHEHT